MLMVLLDLGSWVQLWKNSYPRTLAQEVHLAFRKKVTRQKKWTNWVRKQVTEVRKGPLELRRKKAKDTCVRMEEVGRHRCEWEGGERQREKEGGRGRLSMRVHTGFLVLRIFMFSTGENFRGGLRGGSQQDMHSFPRVSSQGHGLLSGVSTGAEGHYSLQPIPLSARYFFAWLRCFSGPDAETQLRPQCYL